MRKQEFADPGVQRKAMGAIAGGIDKNGAVAIDDVARGDEVAPGLQKVIELCRSFFCLATINSKDGANADSIIDIRLTIERVEQQEVGAARIIFGDWDNVGTFFRG